MLSLSFDLDTILAQLDEIVAILTNIWNSFVELFTGGDSSSDGSGS